MKACVAVLYGTEADQPWKGEQCGLNKADEQEAQVTKAQNLDNCVDTIGLAAGNRATASQQCTAETYLHELEVPSLVKGAIVAELAVQHMVYRSGEVTWV